METLLYRDIQKMSKLLSCFGLRITFVLMMVLWSLPVFALINPDKPDLVKEFESRAEPYQKKIHKAQTTKDFADAYAKYNQFLKKELQSAYQELIATLPAPKRDALKRSQNQWLRYRNIEFEFINENWTLEQFGSSATLSRGGFRARLLENRIIILLRYLQNY